MTMSPAVRRFMQYRRVEHPEATDVDLSNLEDAYTLAEGGYPDTPQVQSLTGVDRSTLSSRWTPLRWHETQQKFLHSKTRFNVVPAGRRSGKTEIAKRRILRKAMLQTRFPNARFIASAPTHLQAKRIFWDDLKALTPKRLLAGRPSESELTIRLRNGSTISVMGLDVPERIEGPPVTHIVLDEYGNMKEKVWKENVRPALSDHEGTADFIGVPEGRNHYYDLSLLADADETGEWDLFGWPSADILPDKEIEAAKRDLDPLTFDQEYNASFIRFQGQAYYQFRTDTHAIHRLKYEPSLPLIICFDFNVAPGIAVFCQEFPAGTIEGSPEFTGVVGEVYVPENSNTTIVCNKIKVSKWAKHAQKVMIYGDPAGGSRGTSQDRGTDWDLIRGYLAPVYGNRMVVSVAKGAPRVRTRLNAMNSRLMSAAELVRLRVDPVEAPETVKDFEGVRLDKDGGIDKSDDKLTHITDAIGYYVHRRWPLTSGKTRVRQM